MLNIHVEELLQYMQVMVFIMHICVNIEARKQKPSNHAFI